MSTSSSTKQLQSHRVPRLTPKDYPTLSRVQALQLCRAVNRGETPAEAKKSKEQRRIDKAIADAKAMQAAKS